MRVRGRSTALARPELVGIHAEAHGAAGLAPVEAGFHEDLVEPFGLGLFLHQAVGELAHATNRDQKDMLLELISSPRIVKLDSVKDPWNYGEPYDSYPIDTARLRRVVEVVADKGRWGRTVPKGHGLGIAVHRSFVSYIATIVEAGCDGQKNERGRKAEG